MSTIAYWNGTYLSDLPRIPVTDAGFVLGTTVAEQVRTFRGRPFRLTDHLDRLLRGLQMIELASPLSKQEWTEVVERVAMHNHRLLDPEDDLGVTLFATPGAYSAYTLADERPSPTYCVHSYPLPFRLWHQRYRQGCSLQTVSVQQVSPNCWPPALKCRSRMHYYLATQEARRLRPGSMALLLDEHGMITETPTANLVAHLPSEGLVSPARDQILPGISLAVLGELSEQLGMPLNYRPLTPADLRDATELLLTSTPFCLIPVADFDGHFLPTDRPVYERLLAAWSDLAEVPIVAQSERFANR